MDTAEKVQQFIAKNFYVPDDMSLEKDVSLLDSGIVDSTGVLEIVEFLSETFGIAVDDMEMVPENLDTISRIVDFVARKQQQAASAAS
jgi:acyl carrier protein